MPDTIITVTPPARTLTVTVDRIAALPANGLGVLTNDGTGTLTWNVAGSGSGSVTTVSIAAANGITGTVATATSTPVITLALGAITPTSVAASGNLTGANLSGTNTGDETLATLKTKLGITTLSGSNTGDQDLSSYATTASLSSYALTASLGSLATQSGTFSGSHSGTTSGTNTGDETLATIKTKLGITTLSGSNTGDQDLSSYATTASLSSYALTASLGTLASQSGTFSGSHSGTTSGTNTGDQDLSGYLPTASAATTYVPVTRTINGSALSGDVTITAITGNAGTATALATPRAINGTNFDGTAAITVTAAAGTLTGTTLNATVTGSSLTSVGTLAGLTSSAAIEARNGATAVPAYVYNTYTSGTNYERLAFEWAANVARIGTQKGSGGGTARTLDFITDGTTRVSVDSGGLNGPADMFGGATTPIAAYLRVKGNVVSLGTASNVTLLMEGAAQKKLVAGSDWALGFGSVTVGTEAALRTALDSAFSRISAGVIAVGNGTAGDFSGFIQDLYRRKGSGSPEGVVAAPVGAVYHRTDGSTGTSFYVKETGTTTSSGWVAK